MNRTLRTRGSSVRREVATRAEIRRARVGGTQGGRTVVPSFQLIMSTTDRVLGRMSEVAAPMGTSGRNRPGAAPVPMVRATLAARCQSHEVG